MREGLRSNTLSQRSVKKGNSRGVVKPVVRRLTRQRVAEKKTVVTDRRGKKLDGEVPPSLESEVETKSPGKPVSAENAPTEDNSQKNSEEDKLGPKQDSTPSEHEEAGMEQNDEIRTEQALMKLECEENTEHGGETLELNVNGSGQDETDDINTKNLPSSSDGATVEVTFTKDCTDTCGDLPPDLESFGISNNTASAATDPTHVEDEETRTQEQGGTVLEVGTSDLQDGLPELRNCSEKPESGVQSSQGELGGSNCVTEETKEKSKRRGFGKVMKTRIAALGNGALLVSGQEIQGIVTRTRKRTIEGIEGIATRKRKRTIDCSKETIERDGDPIKQSSEKPAKKHPCGGGNRMNDHSVNSIEVDDDQFNQSSEHPAKKFECAEGNRMVDLSEKSVEVGDDQINQSSEHLVKKHECDDGNRMVEHSEKSNEVDDQIGQSSKHPLEKHERDDGNRMVEHSKKSNEVDDDQIDQSSKHPLEKHECDEGNRMIEHTEKSIEVDGDQINQSSEHPVKKRECDDGNRMIDHCEKSTEVNDQINQSSEHPIKEHECDDGNRMVDHSEKSTEVDDDQVNQSCEHPLKQYECDDGNQMIDHYEMSTEADDDQINQSSERHSKDKECDEGNRMIDHSEKSVEIDDDEINQSCEHTLKKHGCDEGNRLIDYSEKSIEVGDDRINQSSEHHVEKHKCDDGNSLIDHSENSMEEVDDQINQSSEHTMKKHGFDNGDRMIDHSEKSIGDDEDKINQNFEPPVNKHECNEGNRTNDCSKKFTDTDGGQIIQSSDHPVKKHGCDEENIMLDCSEKSIETDYDQINQLSEHPVKKHGCDGGGMTDYSEKAIETDNDQINYLAEHPEKMHDCEEENRMIDCSEKSIEMNDDQIDQFSRHPVKKHERDEGNWMIEHTEKCIKVDGGQINQSSEHPVNKHEGDEGNGMIDYSKKSTESNDEHINYFPEQPVQVHECDEGHVKQDKVCDGLISSQKVETAAKVAGPSEGEKKLKRGRGRPRKVKHENNSLKSIVQNREVVDKQAKYVINMLSQGPNKLKRGRGRPRKFDKEKYCLNSMLQNEERFDKGVMEIECCEFNRSTKDLKKIKHGRGRPIKVDKVLAPPKSETQNEEGTDGKSCIINSPTNVLQKLKLGHGGSKKFDEENDSLYSDKEAAKIASGISDNLTEGRKRLKRSCDKPKNYNTDEYLDALLRQEEAAQRKAMRMKVKGIVNCFTNGEKKLKRGPGKPRKVEQVTDALNMTLPNEDAAGVVVNTNKDPRANNGFKAGQNLEGMCEALRSKVKEESEQSVHSEGMSPKDCGGKLQGLDKQNNVPSAGGESGIISRREQKQMVRDEIVEMLTSAGWRIEYRPREGRDYHDPVYVNPEGKTHWSVTLAYKKFQKQVEDGKAGPGPESPNFFYYPIPEERLSVLFRTQHVQRGNGMKAALKHSLPNHQKTEAKSALKSALKSSGKSNKRRRNTSIASAQKSNSSIRKNLKKRRKNALLVRGSGQTPNSSSDEPLSFSGKHSVLSWMIESGIIQHGESVSYRIRSKKVREGNITRDGICCCCCEEVMSVTKFEEHADSRLCQTYENLYLENGLSLLQCQINSWNKLEDSIRSGFHPIDVDGEDPNDDTCGLCGDGGDLVCCDSCPSTFHQGCLNIENFPSGEWQCVYCSCKYCGTADGHVDEMGDADADPKQKSFKPTNSLLTCNLCDQKYHPMCLEEKDAVCLHSEGFTFCRKSCEQIFERLQGFFGVKVDIGDGYTCSLIKRVDIPTDSSNPSRLAVVEQTSKLAVALGVMDECFLPIIDHRSGIHLICNTVYSCGSNFKRLSFQSFFNTILEKDDEIIAAASIRIHGEKLAEMPFIGTRIAYRRQGMCRRLLCGIESTLRALKIEKLVIPAVPSVLETWTNVFGFKPLEKCREEMRHMNVMQFPFTDILQKPLLDQQCTAETTAPVPENGVQIVDFVSVDQVGDGKQNTFVMVDDFCPSKVHNGDAECGRDRSISSEEVHANVSIDGPCASSDSADDDHDMGGGMCGVSDVDSTLTMVVDACKIRIDK